MKIRSFKSLGCLFAMGVMISATGAFAHSSHHNHHSSHHNHHSSSHDSSHCFKSEKIEAYKDQVSADFQTIVAAENQIFTVEGQAADPNPNTNPTVDATIVSNSALIANATADYIEVLRKLGVKESILTLLADENAAWVAAGLNYALAMNLENAGQVGGNQIILADLFLQAGEDLGATFAKIAKDKSLITGVTDTTLLQTQLAQAYRGVLDTNNVFGAIPGDAASQAAAATAIESLIIEGADILGRSLVQGVADQCYKH